MNTLKTLAVALVAITLAGCASTGSPASSTPEPTSSDERSMQPSPAPHAGDAPDGIPDEVWAALVADLGQRLDQPVIDPAIVTAKAMTFNDGSLGCPKPGQAYTQALVDGYQIVVEVDGARYDYRSPGGDSVRLCEGVIEGGG